MTGGGFLRGGEGKSRPSGCGCRWRHASHFGAAAESISWSHQYPWKRPVKKQADDQEGSSDEEEAGWSEALEVANTKISRLQADAKGMVKKSKLIMTAVNQLV